MKLLIGCAYGNGAEENGFGHGTGLGEVAFGHFAAEAGVDEEMVMIAAG